MHNRIKIVTLLHTSKKNMDKNTNIQVVDNFTDNFCGYAALLRKIKQRVLLTQQRVIYAANEEMLRMYWDVGEMLQQSQDADGWGKKTLQRLAVDLKNDYSEIKRLFCTQYAVHDSKYYIALEYTLSARSH